MKILTVVGARPQFIKAAVFSRKVRELTDWKEVIVHTGQHFDTNMSEVFFREMDIPKPHYSLNICKLPHGAMTGRMLEGIEEIIAREKPDLVLVYGDTNSTLAGALAASKWHIPLAHVEAGLRSFNMRMPEEVNRVLTDRLSSLLFVPSQGAIKNLRGEGIEKGIYKVGDIMYDALLYYKAKAHKPVSFEAPEKFALLTLHRQESFEDIEALQGLFSYLEELNIQMPILFPCHPGTYKKLQDNGIRIPDFVQRPVGYFEMLYLLQHCSLAMTDSGGLQKEAFYMKKLCLTLRKETEWTELVDLGVNKLCGRDVQLIDAAITATQPDEKIFDTNPYGSGDAAEQIIKAIKNYLS